MKVLIPREARFLRTPDGEVWIQSATTYAFWQRYLDVFHSVQVLARIEDVPSVDGQFNRSSGPGVEFTALPYYLGPSQYLRRRREFRRALANAVDNQHAVLLRSPGQVSSSARSFLSADRPYGVEVVGDPEDVYAPGAVRHPLRPWFRWWFTRDLRRIVAGANAVSYVTEKALQRKYPATQGAFTTYYSSIELKDESFVPYPRSFAMTPNSVRCVLVGSLDQMYKGPDILIRAVAECRQRGMDVVATIVGDGRYRQEIQELAVRLGVGSNVVFTGQLPSGRAVQQVLDAADLFVLPSRTEGLPRAMIEAMARGLPCIGTRVGGIPELLTDEDLVRPNDAAALASTIVDVASSPARMTSMSTRNLEKAHEYRADVLRARRVSLYEHMMVATRDWQRVPSR